MLALSNLSPWLTAEDDVDTGQHQRQVAYSDLADEFVEQAAIDGDNLRHIGYRVVRQASVASREKDVARSVGQAQAARQRHDHNSGDTAAVERVALHDQNRTAEPRCRA